MARRILVAGATGYLGGFVVGELKRRGYVVRALGRSRAKLHRLQEAPDECVEAEVTRPETLDGVCREVDVVFSSVGITRQRDGLTFRDVDYQGNLNLFQAALREGVKRFIYVSAFNGARLRHLDIAAAHEDFVDELKASGMDYTVIRPTGYFSDMGEILDMARRGSAWLIGSGRNRVNPIHGADLAEVCADAIEGGETEIDVGGPEVVTWNEAAELAFAALGRPPRIRHFPPWLMWSVVRVVRLFSRHQGELLAFFATMATTDVVAPSTGVHRLGDYYRAIAGER